VPRRRDQRAGGEKALSKNRHARPGAGHPRIFSEVKDVDGRDKPGHDEVGFV
jgi:hypothetical protein